MTKYLVYAASIFVIVLLIPWYTQTKIFGIQAYAQLPTSNFKPNVSGTPDSIGASTNSNTATISIHTTNTIHGSNKNILIQEEPVIRKAIVGNINDALYIAKGSVKNNISVSVNAKIINQLAKNRISTTQGLDFTKKLVATELVNAINTIVGNSNTTEVAHAGQISQVVVDNQAICNGIASPTSAACVLTINIHS